MLLSLLSVGDMSSKAEGHRFELSLQEPGAKQQTIDTENERTIEIIATQQERPGPGVEEKRGSRSDSKSKKEKSSSERASHGNNTNITAAGAGPHIRHTHHNHVAGTDKSTEL